MAAAQDYRPPSRMGDSESQGFFVRPLEGSGKIVIDRRPASVGGAQLLA
jgi:hypothetical protein